MMPVQSGQSTAPCPYCHGAKTVTVKDANGVTKEVPCYSCNGQGTKTIKTK